MTIPPSFTSAPVAMIPAILGNPLRPGRPALFSNGLIGGLAIGITRPRTRRPLVAEGGPHLFAGHRVKAIAVSGPDRPRRHGQGNVAPHARPHGLQHNGGGLFRSGTAARRSSGRPARTTDLPPGAVCRRCWPDPKHPRAYVTVYGHGVFRHRRRRPDMRRPGQHRWPPPPSSRAPRTRVAARNVGTDDPLRRRSASGTRT